MPLIPLLTDAGYAVDSLTTSLTGKLFPVMMSQPSAAPELLNDLIREWPPEIYHVDCICFENEQTCAVTFSCKVELLNNDTEAVCSNPLKILALCSFESNCASD